MKVKQISKQVLTFIEKRHHSKLIQCLLIDTLYCDTNIIKYPDTGMADDFFEVADRHILHCNEVKVLIKEEKDYFITSKKYSSIGVLLYFKIINFT